MPKQLSRPARWAALVTEAQAVAEKLEAAKAELAEVLVRFEDLRGEYQDWYDNFPENAQSSPTYEKLSEVVELDFNEDDDVSAMLECVEQAANIELPLGWGRD